MTSIASTTSSQTVSPLSLLEKELAAEVSSGEVSAADESALSTALKDIDAALKSQSTSAGDVQSKVEDLIDAAVDDGKLTSEQADELKNIFSQAFQGASGSDGAATGAGDGGGTSSGTTATTSTDPADTNEDGVVSAAEQAAYDAKTSGASAVSSNSGNATSAETDPGKLLLDFLKVIQDLHGQSSNYTATGQSTATQVASQVVDYQA